MEPRDGETRESILVLEQTPGSEQPLAESLNKNLSNVALTAVASFDEFTDRVQHSPFDIVVLDSDLSVNTLRQVIYELKNNDSQPSVIIVSPSEDSKQITDLYKHGCQRYIIKNERWRDELVIAVRHVLRYRQVVDENLRIRTRLTEANALLEDRNKRLDEFSATVAHDIRGPLGAISMKLEYLLDSYEGQLDEKCNKILDRALQSSKRLTHIVQAMYEFAKLGSRAAKMNRVNLDKLVDEVIKDLAFDETLDIKIGLGELPEVWGNAELLRRVFFNLINNAVKYNDKSERIVNIWAGKTSERSLGQFIEIVVEDNGRGIAEEDMKDIFSMFNRGAAAQTETEGAGIGLAVVQRIVELHYGTIVVDSKLGCGSRFTFTLPVQEINLAG